MKVSIGAQIEEVQRELKLRQNVYSTMVAQGKMRQSVADMHMARMQAVLETLEWCSDNAAQIAAITRTSHLPPRPAAPGDPAPPT